MKHLTLYLRHKRLEKDMTIQDVAKAIGCSVSTYSNKERCKQQFNVNEIKSLAYALDISNEELVKNFLTNVRQNGGILNILIHNTSFC